MAQASSLDNKILWELLILPLEKVRFGGGHMLTGKSKKNMMTSCQSEMNKSLKYKRYFSETPSSNCVHPVSPLGKDF
jgi:hypothetical protein